MEYLQYWLQHPQTTLLISFKPCYKWNTFNTEDRELLVKRLKVLNLIINGIPSILKEVFMYSVVIECFKPYYKWNTFNTICQICWRCCTCVLNLIINGIPSILLL